MKVAFYFSVHMFYNIWL